MHNNITTLNYITRDIEQHQLRQYRKLVCLMVPFGLLIVVVSEIWVVDLTMKVHGHGGTNAGPKGSPTCDLSRL